MKKSYRPLGFLAAAVMFVLGIYLFGHAGANYLEPDLNNYNYTTDSGASLFARNIPMAQFVFGFIITILGVAVFFILISRRFEDEGV